MTEVLLQAIVQPADIQRRKRGKSRHVARTSLRRSHPNSNRDYETEFQSTGEKYPQPIVADYSAGYEQFIRALIVV